MTYSVRITEGAKNNLQSSVDYMRYVLYENNAADNLLNEFKKFVDNVAEFPELYPLIPDTRLTNSKLRKALIKKYVVVYRFENQEITVIGFFHQMQDYARYCY